MNAYLDYVSTLAQLVRRAKKLPLGGFPGLPKTPRPADAPKALLFSPHPDDEVIIGALPLRLLRELQWNVINVAVTHGSRRARQQERLHEVQACCDYIGFGLVQTRPH